MSEENKASQNENNMSVEEVLKKHNTDRKGLSSEEAEKRLSETGPNEIQEEHENPVIKFLRYFWGPIAWMIEAAAVLSFIVQHWADFIIIMVLLIFNAVVGFWQEYQAGNAVDALKKKLALKSRSLRDGKWQEVPARELVPGDIIRLRLGDVIPADVVLLDGDYLSVDQSGLTGESLPVNKKVGDAAYSGSVAKQGEMVAVVTATGMNTYFGRTTKLVEGAGAVSHFQKAVLQIGNYLIYLSLGLVAILIIAQLIRHSPLLSLIEFALVLTVASIPVAMPAVLSVTMAIGALSLSKMKAIVSRLESIEEMAGIDILCSDKTGTLTQNQLTLGNPDLFAAKDEQELILAGALASKEENQDAIDLAVIGGLSDPNVLKDYEQTKFVPFDPVNKRTEGEAKNKEGQTVKFTKGAPQVILDLAEVDGEDRKKAEDIVNKRASKGYRTLGVARAKGENSWEFMGILPLYDPPREDSAETIRQAQEHGIDVRMVTGDNTAIGKEISEQLGLGKNITPAGEFFEEGADPEHPTPGVAKKIEKADGFAQVFPEHKYSIVKALQSLGHLVGMTGDGVNDAPALKQADVGIAVSGATDAARAAAALVLTAPGLSVIVKAVEEARRIFERMNSYAIYRITETIRIMFFMVLAMLVYNIYPITAIMIILLALINDIPIMSIAYDNTWLDPDPVHWDMHRVLTVSTVLGGLGVVETFLLLVVAESYFGIHGGALQSVVFLKLAVAGHMTLFVARTKKAFFSKPYPAPILLAAIIGTKVLAVLIVVYGWLVTPIPWLWVGVIFVYCIAWLFIEDLAKLIVYRHLELGSKHHKKFLGTLKKSTLHSSSS